MGSACLLFPFGQWCDQMRFYSRYKFYWRKNVQTSVDWYLNLYLVMFTFVCDTHNSKSHSDIWQNRYAVLNCFHLLMWVAFLSRVNWGPPFGNSLGGKKKEPRFSWGGCLYAFWFLDISRFGPDLCVNQLAIKDEDWIALLLIQTNFEWCGLVAIWYLSG